MKNLGYLGTTKVCEKILKDICILLEDVGFISKELIKELKYLEND